MSTLAEAKLSLVRVEVHDAAGSGVVVGTNQGNSLVLTAWHVVESFCDEVGHECVGVSVVVGGQRYHGSLLSFNRQEDLAVLDVEGVLPVAKLASGVPQIGTDVVTIGLPEGEHDFQYNEGRIVRHSGCSFDSCLATNARAWSGFSGGALINLDGEIVGVISEGLDRVILLQRCQRRTPFKRCSDLSHLSSCYMGGFAQKLICNPDFLCNSNFHYDDSLGLRTQPWPSWRSVYPPLTNVASTGEIGAYRFRFLGGCR